MCVGYKCEIKYTSSYISNKFFTYSYVIGLRSAHPRQNLIHLNLNAKLEKKDLKSNSEVDLMSSLIYDFIIFAVLSDKGL